MADKAEGLILRTTDYSQTSRIVVWFTREFGKLSTLAKGGRRLRSPFESALDLLATCQIVFLRKTSSNLDLLTEAKLLRRFAPGTRHLATVYAGYYVAELLLGLTADYDPHPQLYEVTQETLQELEQGHEVRKTLLRFEWSLLRELGQLPDLSRCQLCGTGWEQAQTFAYWVSQGGMICAACARQDWQQTMIHTGTIAALRWLSEPGGTAWKRLVLTPQQLQELKAMTHAAIGHVLGHRPKLWSYLP
ncbi:MAG: DNA repair protein RecO [Planctomycetaceae bacterium]|nr:MAG: DNA repair protein RecO [Planctomycetaceae bacterium]